MRSCWEKSPESRPHFSQLVGSLSTFFENTAEPAQKELGVVRTLKFPLT